jgi:hypothetical protein
MRLEPGAVRDAAADGAEAIDEDDAGREAAAQKVRGDRGAAEASADHDDSGGVAAHSRAEDIRAR